MTDIEIIKEIEYWEEILLNFNYPWHFSIMQGIRQTIEELKSNLKLK